MFDSNFVPQARREGLIAQPVEGELMLYNTRREFVHLLNPTAAQVWELCDGKRNVREIAARVSAAAGAPIDEHAVWFALKQLEQRQLVAPLAPSHPLPALTRREFLTKAALAAALIPAVRTIKTPQTDTNQSLAPVVLHRPQSKTN